MKKERNIALAVCAVLAALILLLTSQSSPLYVAFGLNSGPVPLQKVSAICWHSSAVNSSGYCASNSTCSWCICSLEVSVTSK